MEISKGNPWRMVSNTATAGRLRQAYMTALKKFVLKKKKKGD
jgi:hypothetical protein